MKVKELCKFRKRAKIREVKNLKNISLHLETMQ